MADNKNKDKLYNFLSNQFSDFNYTREDFYNKIKTPENREKAYKLINDNFSDFNISYDEFNSKLDADEIGNNTSKYPLIPTHIPIQEQPKAHFMLSPQEVTADPITDKPLSKEEWDYINRGLPPAPSITTPHITTDEAIEEERVNAVPEYKNRYELFKKEHPTLGVISDIAKGSVMIPAHMYGGIVQNIADAYSYSNKPTTEDLKYNEEKYRKLGWSVPPEQFEEAKKLEEEAKQGLIAIPKDVLESSKMNLKDAGLDPYGVVSFALDKLSSPLSPRAYTGAISLLKATNAAIEAAFIVGIGKGAVVNPLAESLKLSALEALGMAFPTATEAVFSPVSVAMKAAGIPEPTRVLGQTALETGNLLVSVGAIHAMGKGQKSLIDWKDNLKEKYTEYKTEPPPPSKPISPETNLSVPKYDAQAELSKTLQGFPAAKIEEVPKFKSIPIEELPKFKPIPIEEVPKFKPIPKEDVPKVIDLVERIVKGENTSSPNDLQTLQNYPKHIEKLLNFAKRANESAEQIKKEIPIGQKEKQIGLEDELKNRQVPKDKGVWRDKFNKSTKISEKEKILMDVARGSRNEKELNDVKVAATGMPNEGKIIDAAESKIELLSKKEPSIETKPAEESLGLKKFKIKYKGGKYKIVEAESPLEVVKKYDLASKKNINTKVEEFKVEESESYNLKQVTDPKKLQKLEEKLYNSDFIIGENVGEYGRVTSNRYMLEINSNVQKPSTLMENKMSKEQILSVIPELTEKHQKYEITEAYIPVEKSRTSYDEIDLTNKEGGKATLNKSYLDYFIQKYGNNIELFAEGRNKPFVVKLKNKMIGVIMPMRADETRDERISHIMSWKKSTKALGMIVGGALAYNQLSDEDKKTANKVISAGFLPLIITTKGKEETKSSKHLLVTHNTNEKKILEYAALEGYPRPSLAVSTKRMSHFGEITFIYGEDVLKHADIYDTDMFSPTSPNLIDGRKKFTSSSGEVKEATSDNIINEMNTFPLLGGEEGAHLGGIRAIRALLGKKLETIADIKKEKKSLVSYEDFTKQRRYFADEYSDIIYDWIMDRKTNQIKNFSIDENSITKAIMDGIRNNNIKKQLIELGIPEKDINMSQLNEFLGKLKQMPSYYFEGKAQKEVPFSDIKVAIVPENTSKEVLDILMENNPNIEIAKYKSRDEGERFKHINELGSKYALGLAGALGVGAYSQLSDENKDKALEMAAIPLASMYVKKGGKKTRKEWVDVNMERKAGETDRNYRKRLAKEVPNIKKLGANVEDYFKKNPEGEGEGVKINISNLKFTKEATPQEIENAKKYLEFGYLDVMGKREFIKVRVNNDGNVEIVDGNETTAALKAGGKKYVMANFDAKSLEKFYQDNLPKYNKHQNKINSIVEKYTDGETAFSGRMSVKSKERIIEKVTQEKLPRLGNSNINETIKDIARQDLIVSDKNSIESIFNKVLEDVEGMGFEEVKTNISSKKKGKSDGFESHYIKIKDKNGIWGEIQVVDINTYAAKNGTYKLTNPKLIKKINQIEKDVESVYGQPIPKGVGHWLYEVSRDKSLPKNIRHYSKQLSKKYYGYYKNFNSPVAKKLSTKSSATGSPDKNLFLDDSYSSEVRSAFSWDTQAIQAVSTSSSSFISRFTELSKKLNSSAAPSAKSHLMNVPESVKQYIISILSSIPEYNKKINTKQDKSSTIFTPSLGAVIAAGIGIGAYNQLSDRDKNAINNILGKVGALGGGLAIAGVLTGGERSKVVDILQKLGDKRPSTEIEKLSDKELIDTLRKVKEEISKSPIEKETQPTEKTERPPIIGKKPSTTKGYNERKIHPEARDEVIKFYEENPEIIDKYRRGTISNKETIEEATKIAETISVEDVNLLKSGDVKKAEDILAYRMVAQNELIKAVKEKQNSKTTEEISTAEMNIVKAGIGISKVNALLTEAARGTQSGTIKIPYKVSDNTLVEITREAKEVLNNIDKVGESGRGLGVDLLGDIKYKLNSEQVEGVKLAIDELANMYEREASKSNITNEAKDLLKEILVDNQIDFTPENVKKLKKAISKIKNIKGKKAISEILTEHNKNPKAFDKFSFWFYNSILSNPITDFRNLIGNTSNFAFEFIYPYLKADAVGKKRMRDSFWKGVEKGKIEAHRIYEGDIKDPSKFQEIASMESRFDLHPTTKAGKIGRAMLPTTRLAIEDAMYRSVANSIELGEAKYKVRDIFKDKLDRLDEIIKEEMENVESGKEFEYKGDLSKEQNVKIKEILEGVNEFEKRLVFQSELGKFGKGSQQISNSSILAKIILPFVRIGINLAKTSYEASPLGFTKLFGEKASKMSERERKHIIRRAQLGTLFYSALGVGMASGYIQVTGKLSRDKDKNEILNKLGYKPNHIYFGNKGFNYMNIAPFGYFLSLVGAVSDEYKYGRENDDYMEKFGSAVLASMESITDQSYLQGISRLTKAIRERDGSYFESLATSFIPNIASFPRDVRDIYRGEKFDYEKKNLGDKIKYKFGMDESLTPKYNVWGEKKEVAYSNLPFPLAKFDKKGKELEMFLIENDFNVSKPSPSTYIGDRKMTTEEYSEYSKLVGLKTRDLLVNKFEGLKRVSKVSKERAQNIIDESTDIAKKIAKNKIINKKK